MKQASKVHRNFKMKADIEKKLRKESKKTGASQTWILELALAEYFAVKR